jgi:hypothetical protein
VFADGRSIYSYGYHFPMATLMTDDTGLRNEHSWWLVNGDTYSVSTSRHQGEVRGALRKTGLPMLIVPFSALNRARIDYDTVRRVAIDPERWVPEQHSSARVEDMPYHLQTKYAQVDGAWRHVFVDPADDGLYHWESKRHFLGASVFTATYEDRDAEPYDKDMRYVGYPRVTATFLSAFDENERTPLYFLCELPQGCEPQTVEEAFECLKPNAVKTAEALGRTVLRQGDVFAIPVDLTTRDLRKAGFTSPAPPKYSRLHMSKNERYVLGVNHTATEVLTSHGVTYARGTLRHKPAERGRQPEHRMVKLGKGWHALIRNTVPDGRSWSIGGKVD